MTYTIDDIPYNCPLCEEELKIEHLGGADYWYFCPNSYKHRFWHYAIKIKNERAIQYCLIVGVLHLVAYADHNDHLYHGKSILSNLKDPFNIAQGKIISQIPEIDLCSRDSIEKVIRMLEVFS